jgi:hypothetical protein
VPTPLGGTINITTPNTILSQKGGLIVGTGGGSVQQLTVGADGTTLVANSASATGMAWATANAIPLSTVTAKGDLLAATGPGTVTNLPVGVDGTTLVANSASATGVAWAGPTFAAGKNKIINGDFGIWQRGTSFSNPTDAQYVADRFVIAFNGSGTTRTVSQQTFDYSASPAADKLPITGYPSTYFLRNAVTVAGTGATYHSIQQKIEDVKIFAGQIITISFWAKAETSRTTTFGVYQQFGSGGSGTVFPAGGTATLTTSWARYSGTITVPPINGKTIGTGSFLAVVIDCPQNAISTTDIWGVQVEAGSVATPFTTATGTVQGELAACQRYFYTPLNTTTDGIGGSPFLGMGWASSTTTAYILCSFPVTMRAIPSYTYSYASSSLSITTASYGITTVTSLGADQIMQRNAILSFSASGGGLVAGNAAGVRHDGAGTYIAQFSAEL